MPFSRHPWERIPPSRKSGHKPPLRLREAAWVDASERRLAPGNDPDDGGQVPSATDPDAALRRWEKERPRVAGIP